MFVYPSQSLAVLIVIPMMTLKHFNEVENSLEMPTLVSNLRYEASATVTSSRILTVLHVICMCFLLMHRVGKDRQNTCTLDSTRLASYIG